MIVRSNACNNVEMMALKIAKEKGLPIKGWIETFDDKTYPELQVVSENQEKVSSNIKDSTFTVIIELGKPDQIEEFKFKAIKKLLDENMKPAFYVQDEHDAERFFTWAPIWGDDELDINITGYGPDEEVEKLLRKIIDERL